MEDLTTKQKVIYITLLALLQAFQLAGVLLISYINGRIYEFIGIYSGMIIGKLCFPTSWHADKLIMCTLVTFVVYYFLTSGVIPIEYSISCSVVFGYILSYFLYKAAIIKEIVNAKVNVSADDNGTTEIELKRLSESEIRKLCNEKNFSEWDTNFLIEFYKNPNGLKKYEIADKYRKDEKYMYRYVKSLLKKLNS